MKTFKWKITPNYLQNCMHSAVFNPEFLHVVCQKITYFSTKINQWNSKFNTISNLIKQVRGTYKWMVCYSASKD